jgi:hypothetical protein
VYPEAIKYRCSLLAMNAARGMQRGLLLLLHSRRRLVYIHTLCARCGGRLGPLGCPPPKPSRRKHLGLPRKALRHHHHGFLVGDCAAVPFHSEATNP